MFNMVTLVNNTMLHNLKFAKTVEFKCSHKKVKTRKDNYMR